MGLHPDFLTKPLAHRGLHDVAKGIIECSPSAFQTAIDHGYGIELDVQESMDGQAIVFHDATLDRLTNSSGPLSERTASELGNITLNGSTDTIPTLASILEQVAGQVPLLIEIKDQDGSLGTAIGNLSADIAKVLKYYLGPVGVMSYNAHAVDAVRQMLGDIPVGLVTSGHTDVVFEHLTPEQRKSTVEMQDFNRIGGSFISHNHQDLGSPHVENIKRQGLPVLTWTIRSNADEKKAREIADNITFEGYLA